MAGGLGVALATIFAYVTPVYFLMPARARTFMGPGVHFVDVGGFIESSRSLSFNSEFLPVKGAENFGMLTSLQVTQILEPKDSLLRYELAATYRAFEDKNQQAVAFAGAHLKWRDNPRETKVGPEVGIGYYARLSPILFTRTFFKIAFLDQEQIGDADIRLLFRSNMANSSWFDGYYVAYRYSTGLADHSNLHLLSVGISLD